MNPTRYTRFGGAVSENGSDQQTSTAYGQVFTNGQPQVQGMQPVAMQPHYIVQQPSTNQRIQYVQPQVLLQPQQVQFQNGVQIGGQRFNQTSFQPYMLQVINDQNGQRVAYVPIHQGMSVQQVGFLPQQQIVQPQVLQIQPAAVQPQPLRSPPNPNDKASDGNQKTNSPTSSGQGTNSPSVEIERLSSDTPEKEKKGKRGESSSGGKQSGKQKKPVSRRYSKSQKIEWVKMYTYNTPRKDYAYVKKHSASRQTGPLRLVCERFELDLAKSNINKFRLQAHVCLGLYGSMLPPASIGNKYPVKFHIVIYDKKTDTRRKVPEAFETLFITVPTTATSGTKEVANLCSVSLATREAVFTVNLTNNFITDPDKAIFCIYFALGHEIKCKMGVTPEFVMPKLVENGPIPKLLGLSSYSGKLPEAPWERPTAPKRKASVDSADGSILKRHKVKNQSLGAVQSPDTYQEGSHRSLNPLSPRGNTSNLKRTMFSNSKMSSVKIKDERYSPSAAQLLKKLPEAASSLRVVGAPETLRWIDGQLVWVVRLRLMSKKQSLGAKRDLPIRVCVRGTKDITVDIQDSPSPSLDMSTRVGCILFKLTRSSNATVASGKFYLHFDLGTPGEGVLYGPISFKDARFTTASFVDNLSLTSNVKSEPRPQASSALSYGNMPLGQLELRVKVQFAKKALNLTLAEMTQEIDLSDIPSSVSNSWHYTFVEQDPISCKLSNRLRDWYTTCVESGRLESFESLGARAGGLEDLISSTVYAVRQGDESSQFVHSVCDAPHFRWRNLLARKQPQEKNAATATRRQTSLPRKLQHVPEAAPKMVIDVPHPQNMEPRSAEQMVEAKAIVFPSANKMLGKDGSRCRIKKLLGSRFGSPMGQRKDLNEGTMSLLQWLQPLRVRRKAGRPKRLSIEYPWEGKVHVKGVKRAARLEQERVKPVVVSLDTGEAARQLEDLKLRDRVFPLMKLKEMTYMSLSKELGITSPEDLRKWVQGVDLDSVAVQCAGEKVCAWIKKEQYNMPIKVEEDEESTNGRYLAITDRVNEVDASIKDSLDVPVTAETTSDGTSDDLQTKAPSETKDGAAEAASTNDNKDNTPEAKPSNENKGDGAKRNMKETVPVPVPQNLVKAVATLNALNKTMVAQPVEGNDGSLLERLSAQRPKTPTANNLQTAVKLKPSEGVDEVGELVRANSRFRQRLRNQHNFLLFPDSLIQKIHDEFLRILKSVIPGPDAIRTDSQEFYCSNIKRLMEIDDVSIDKLGTQLELDVQHCRAALETPSNESEEPIVKARAKLTDWLVENVRPIVENILNGPILEQAGKDMSINVKDISAWLAGERSLPLRVIQNMLIWCTVYVRLKVALD